MRAKMKDLDKDEEYIDEIDAVYEDLYFALRVGWCSRENRCNYCGKIVDHTKAFNGKICNHTEDCLMTKYSDMFEDK
jgi:hypothetical protein